MANGAKRGIVLSFQLIFGIYKYIHTIRIKKSIRSEGNKKKCECNVVISKEKNKIKKTYVRIVILK